MKNAVLIFCNLIFWAFTLLIIMAIAGRMNRSVELKSNLSTAMEAVVGAMAVDVADGKSGVDTVTGMAVVETIEEMRYRDEILAVAECVERLAVAIDTDSCLQVDVMKADAEKGILALRVTERFEHPNGKEGTVSCERVAIWDRTYGQEEVQCEIKFYRTKEDMTAGRNCYKTYVVRKGDSIAAPAAPMMEGRVFKGWMAADGCEADFSRTIEKNQIYYAKW